MTNTANDTPLDKVAAAAVEFLRRTELKPQEVQDLLRVTHVLGEDSPESTKPEIAQSALKFMSRITIRAHEINAFLLVMQYLRKSAEAKAGDGAT